MQTPTFHKLERSTGLRHIQILLALFLFCSLALSGCVSNSRAAPQDQQIRLDLQPTFAKDSDFEIRDSLAASLNFSLPWVARINVNFEVSEASLFGERIVFSQANNSVTIPYLLANMTYVLELRTIDGKSIQLEFSTPPFDVSEKIFKPLRPGEMLLTSGGRKLACPPGFLVSDARGELYFTIAAHCGLEGEVWEIYSHDYAIVPVGEVVLSGIYKYETILDIGLLRVYPEVYDMILPSLVGDNGPSRPPRSVRTGESICLYGQGGASYDALIAQANGNGRILPDMRYRCGEVGSNQIEAYQHFREHGEVDLVVGQLAGDSGAPIVATDGSPVGYGKGSISGALPSPGSASAISICFALRELWDVGYELGISLGESTPNPSLYTFKAIPWDPQTVECDEAAPYLTVPYKSWQLREAGVF